MLIDDSRLTITDGDLVYRSRQKWKIVASSFGDLDHDSLPRGGYLVDDEEGRHIGLLAWFGGEYRRRRIVAGGVVPLGGAGVLRRRAPRVYEEDLPRPTCAAT